MSGKYNDTQFFILPDIASELSQLDHIKDEEERQTKKDELLSNYAVKSERVHTVNQLLKAYALFDRDDQYVVIDGQVKIVDEQTGRILEGRRYSEGLHQAIEAKERVHEDFPKGLRAVFPIQPSPVPYAKAITKDFAADQIARTAGQICRIFKPGI